MGSLCDLPRGQPLSRYGTFKTAKFSAANCVAYSAKESDTSGATKAQTRSPGQQRANAGHIKTSVEGNLCVDWL